MLTTNNNTEVKKEPWPYSYDSRLLQNVDSHVPNRTIITFLSYLLMAFSGVNRDNTRAFNRLQNPSTLSRTRKFTAWKT